MRAPTPPQVVQARRRTFGIIAAIAVALLVALGGLSTFYTEILWFREVDAGRVFWTSVWTRVGMGVAFGSAFAVVLLVNLWVARKITNPARMFSVPDAVLERYRATLQPYAKRLVIGGSIAFGVFAGSGATVKWREWLLYRNATTFGELDPLFNKDLGFFVFKLPFLQFVFTWAFSTLVLAILVTGAAHYFMGGIRPQARGDRVAPEVRAHISVLLGLLVLLKAWGYRLDQYNLLYSDRGVVDGASYTDVNAQMPALWLLIVISIVCSLFFFVNARFKNWILPLAGIGLLALTSVAAGGIYPAAVQRLRVTPNERQREAPYILRNINATRKAFGIDAIDLRPLNPTESLRSGQVGANRQTIENIRLWEPSVLERQYVSQQRISPYYEFLDVDVDRYDFGSGRRMVMLSAREVSPAGLPDAAQTWLNRHLFYTHGYGVAASRVDRVTGEGRPQYIVQNIPENPPLVAVDGSIKIDEPRVYFGENDEVPFVVTNSSQRELDYPQGAGFAEYSYDGKGGVPLSGVMTRAAFAWRFRDVNLLISGALGADSRIMFRRSILDRVHRVAPFVSLDSDPYVTMVGGRLVWLIDGYTSTAMYPYSQRISFTEISDRGVSGSGNYIRNSVKFTVDAKDGTITGYVWDEQDPLLRAWMKVFPDSLKAKSAMPASIREHVRYPEGLYKLQSDRFGSYHITDPSNFYGKEDAWLVARDPSRIGTDSSPSMPPYYVLMRLPGEKELSFVLVRPFAPVGRQNMIAYMVAHSDPENYGQLVTYVLPKSGSFFGPEQVQARINQDPAVSQQLTLWGQQQSQVIYGNLLIVPIEQSLLYVQPLYLQGAGSNIPELKRVVAVSGESVRMGDTLSDALAAIFRGTPSQIDDGDEQTVTELLQEALDHDRRAQAALREGDFATYGRETNLMREALQKAATQSGAAPSPTPSPSPSR